MAIVDDSFLHAYTSMMADVNVPWLSLAGDDHQDPLKSEDMDVEHEDASPGHVSDGSVGISAKRKRTSSLASPPKVCSYDVSTQCDIDSPQIDGGPGPSKRPRDYCMPNEVGRCGTTATLVYRELSHNANTRSLSPAPLEPSDATNDLTIGPQVQDPPDGYEPGAESVCGDNVLQTPRDSIPTPGPGVSESVSLNTVPPTPTQTTPTPESIRNAADVSSLTFSATNLNLLTGMVAQHCSQR